jgi:hypothetical protein
LRKGKFDHFNPLDAIANVKSKGKNEMTLLFLRFTVWRSASSALSKFPRRSFSFVHRFQAFFLIDGHAPKAQEVGRVSFLCMFE